MPKGKKKGGKQEAPKEEPPAEAPPPQVEEEEEECGLGLGGSNRRQAKKEKKLKQEMARLASTTDRAPVVPKELSAPPAEEPKPKTESEGKIEELEDFDGLGLGAGKKRKPRKKKGDSQPEMPTPTAPPGFPSQSASTTAPMDTPMSQPISAPISGPELAPVLHQEAGPPATSWGRGRGQRPAEVIQPSQTQPQFAGQLPMAHSQVQYPQPEQFPPTPIPTHVQQAGPKASSWGRGRGRAPSEPMPPSQTLQQKPLPRSQPELQTRPQQQVQPHSKTPPARTTGQYSQENVVCRYKIPRKIPGRTIPTRHMVLITNYLTMTFKSLKIYRYDVSFTPDRPKKFIPEVFKKVKQLYYAKELLAFDQTKNCYSLRQLKNIPANERFNHTVEIIDNNGRPMKFEVSMKSTGVVDLEKIKRYMAEGGTSVLHPTEEVQCIDVILRQGTLESYVKAGRQFFKRPQNPLDLGHGYEMWTGLFQSAIFTNKSFINIDVAHKGFPKHQSLINALKNDFRLDTNMPIEKQRSYEIDNFLQFIKGLRVVATLVGSTPTAGQKREFICNGLVDPPSSLKFTLTDANGKEREMTVAQYFATEKKYRIQYPNLNCMWVGPRDKTIYFPMELLEVSYGQPLARQLNETQIAKMVREAATPPDQRLRKITEVISSMKYSQNKDFQSFGLEISDKFYEVNAKVLEPPALDIGRGNVIPRKGCWQANNLLKPETLNSWGFIAIDTQPSNDFEGVIQMLVSTGKQMGMNISQPLFKQFNVTITNLHNVMRTALDRDIKFLFVVVSMRGRDYYHKVKQMAEREVGMLTQCLKEATTRRMNVMTAKNILLKVNSKLMGINQALNDKTMPRCLKDGGVMIVGADVTHPSPDQSNVPSIAAVTASIDPKCYMYNIELSVQTPKKEMIVEFEDMMFDHLKLYKEKNMKLPRKIFVFRDGVSEGQFVQVMNSELAAVHAAYERMAGAGKKPEILFLLVQKRHHTRFFNKGNSSSYNVEPGTVVDTDIVHASELDFYLVSHQANKGTARPTRYHAVCNDGKIPDDEVEQLTFYLCHLYSRCMRSVSYPTPTYYAHLACLRARSLTFGQKFNNKELERKPERLHVLDKMLQFSRMFFV